VKIPLFRSDFSSYLIRHQNAVFLFLFLQTLFSETLIQRASFGGCNPSCNPPLKNALFLTFSDRKIHIALPGFMHRRAIFARGHLLLSKKSLSIAENSSFNPFHILPKTFFKKSFRVQPAFHWGCTTPCNCFLIFLLHSFVDIKIHHYVSQHSHP
jgi:hypothetical protein